MSFSAIERGLRNENLAPSQLFQDLADEMQVHQIDGGDLELHRIPGWWMTAPNTSDLSAEISEGVKRQKLMLKRLHNDTLWKTATTLVYKLGVPPIVAATLAMYAAAATTSVRFDEDAAAGVREVIVQFTPPELVHIMKRISDELLSPVLSHPEHVSKGVSMVMQTALTLWTAAALTGRINLNSAGQALERDALLMRRNACGDELKLNLDSAPILSPREQARVEAEFPFSIVVDNLNVPVSMAPPVIGCCVTHARKLLAVAHRSSPNESSELQVRVHVNAALVAVVLATDVGGRRLFGVQGTRNVRIEDGDSILQSDFFLLSSLAYHAWGIAIGTLACGTIQNPIKVVLADVKIDGNWYDKLILPSYVLTSVLSANECKNLFMKQVVASQMKKYKKS